MRVPTEISAPNWLEEKPGLRLPRSRDIAPSMSPSRKAMMALADRAWIRPGSGPLGTSQLEGAPFRVRGDVDDALA